MTDRPAPPRRVFLIVLAATGVALVLLASLSWLNRRMLAREALTGWLRSRGVAADAQVEEIGPTVFTARLRIGDPARPDFAADRAEVRYRLRPTGVEVLSVALRAPVLRAQLRADGLHVGALDPLVQEFLRRPPTPGAPKPRVTIDGGTLLLATDYGQLRAAADAVVDDGRLQSLAARVGATALKGPDWAVTLQSARVTATTRGRRVDVRGEAAGDGRVAGADLRGGRVTFAGVLPYPDLERRRFDGPMTLKAELAARQMGFGPQSANGARLAVDLNGALSGGLADLAWRGAVDGRVSADRAEAGEVRISRPAATFGAPVMAWAWAGGTLAADNARVTVASDRVEAGALRLTRVAAEAAGPLRLDGAGVTGRLTARAGADGAWSGLGGPARRNGPELRRLKAAAGAFHVAAPAVTVARGATHLVVGLPQPVRLTTTGGGEAVLTARAGAPLFGPRGGAFRLTAGGGGLPSVTADVARLDLRADGVRAQGAFGVRGSFGPLRDGRLATSGALQARPDGLVFTASRCADVGAGRLQFDANAVTDVAARLCPAGGPLFAADSRGWRLRARAEGVRAGVPFAEVRIADGSGPLQASGVGDDLRVRARIAAATLDDTAATARFRPLRLAGDVTLADWIWRGDIVGQTPAGAPLGEIKVTYDGRLGFGAAVFDTGLIPFAEGGLQPAQLSPAAAAIGSPARGSARFEGRFDWSPAGATSRGTLTVPGLDFQSPAGPVKGLNGVVAFDSLAPLVAAPGQELTVARLDGAVLLTNLHARFALKDQLLQVEGGEASVGGGMVRVETLEVPLVPGAAIRGILHVEGVQLHDLVEASPFGDKVELDAKVSGHVPFELTGTKLRISAGELKAIQPGRISINRAALTGVQAEGALTGPAAPADPNATFTDFAYQAMENLAFDTLEATLASRRDGRLGVLFHIVGRHDPPQKQQIRLTLADLIQRKFLGRKLPLPSGTKVNLTLDSSLNLDDLMADYAEYQKARGSAPVQP